MERLTRDQKLSVTSIVIGLLSGTVFCVIGVAAAIAPAELRQVLGLKPSPVASPPLPPRVNPVGAPRLQETGVARKVHRSNKVRNTTPSRSSAQLLPATSRVQTVVAKPTPAPFQRSRADSVSARTSPHRESAPSTTREASGNTPPRQDVVRTDTTQKIQRGTEGSALSGPNIRSPEYKDDGAEFGNNNE